MSREDEEAKKAQEAQEATDKETQNQMMANANNNVSINVQPTPPQNLNLGDPSLVDELRKTAAQSGFTESQRDDANSNLKFTNPQLGKDQGNSIDLQKDGSINGSGIALPHLLNSISQSGLGAGSAPPQLQAILNIAMKMSQIGQTFSVGLTPGGDMEKDFHNTQQGAMGQKGQQSQQGMGQLMKNITEMIEKMVKEISGIMNMAHQFSMSDPKKGPSPEPGHGHGKEHAAEKEASRKQHEAADKKAHGGEHHSHGKDAQKQHGHHEHGQHHQHSPQKTADNGPKKWTAASAQSQHAEGGPKIGANRQESGISGPGSTPKLQPPGGGGKK